MSALLRFSSPQPPRPNSPAIRRPPNPKPAIPLLTIPPSIHLRSSRSIPHNSFLAAAGGGNGESGGRGYSGGGGGDGDYDRSGEKPNPSDPVGPIGLFLSGWRSRVSADPQFPFKVLMEELVGVSASALGDMASRPNFGLGELDFVFCTIVVGSIANFVLMYLLAPTAALSSSTSALPSYMFEPGPFSALDRIGTFAYKGAMFAAVGFVAGIAGTAISNGLIALRKKMDPDFETPNKSPPTVLNALTWAIHMGLSSNFRYQSLNGVEFVMEKALPSSAFKGSVVALRCLNNVIGGMSFVMLARLTGSQKSGAMAEGELQRTDSHCK